MTGDFPQILALDFDGVICDGLREYFQTTKRTYQRIWHNTDAEQLDSFAEPFYRLRPVIETGWEMPLLLRALVLGIAENDILTDWEAIVKQLLEKENLDRKNCAQLLDSVRDHWIQTDVAGWLALHRFYSGIIERLIQVLDSPTQLYIITTKEGRFVQQLLQQQGLSLPSATIFGKEVKRPKYETLTQLLQNHSLKPDRLWFVEDLLKTLLTVAKQPNLEGIKLYLADWGYNTEEARQSVSSHPTIKRLSLSQFSQDFSRW